VVGAFAAKWAMGQFIDRFFAEMLNSKKIEPQNEKGACAPFS